MSRTLDFVRPRKVKALLEDIQSLAKVLEGGSVHVG